MRSQKTAFALLFPAVLVMTATRCTPEEPRTVPQQSSSTPDQPSQAENGDEAPWPGSALLPGASSRTSPFAPPIQDAFVTDTGAGLDTFCTFNTDPENPLRIDIVVDRAVGEVDAHGYLMNPEPLIAKGIIPATVDVTMPAYDVDVNGRPKPELDQVLLNGELLGPLTGNNFSWMLNVFVVDIRKIKFPAPPAAGLAPTPVTNRIQVNIDTLGSRMWCTSIDWVALHIPIRPVVALTLEPRGGNKMRQNTTESTIEVIYKQTVNAACEVTTDIDSFDKYPFSAPSSASAATLHAKLEPCPKGSLGAPLVKVDWGIGSTGIKGISTFTGLEGDVNLSMPNVIGAYPVLLKFDVNHGQAKIDVSRKELVTKAPPLATIGVPRRAWYEKGTAWASGQNDDDKILVALRNGIYGYGNHHWRYGYRFGEVGFCSWDQLLADPIQCDYSNCFGLSNVFENIAAVLGVGGLTPIITEGSHPKNYFLTVVAPSFDLKFPGSAKLVGSSIYDRYMFTCHSLREKQGTYYDATFNASYSSANAFIAANLNGESAVDEHGLSFSTDEGYKIYRLAEQGYDSWGAFEYQLPSAPASPALTGVAGAGTAAMPGIRFTGDASYQPGDGLAPGISEALIADVEVEVVIGGSYSIIGVLKKRGGDPIANRPIFMSASSTHAYLKDRSPGVYQVSLQFSGEQIFRSGEDGPYDLDLVAIGGGSPVSTTLPTSTIDHTRFGEIGATIGQISDAAAATDHRDGQSDAMELTVEIMVREAGDYHLEATIERAGIHIADAGGRFTLQPGMQAVKLRLPGKSFCRAGIEGPYSGVVNLLNAKSESLEGKHFATQAYSAKRFTAPLLPSGRFIDRPVDLNHRGLFDSLQVTLGLDIKTSGTYRVSGILRSTKVPQVVFSEESHILSTGSHEITLQFSGSLINAQAIDGPYYVEVIARDPATLEELDRVTVPQQTANYAYKQFSLATDSASSRIAQPID